MDHFQSIQKYLWTLRNDSDYSTLSLKHILSWIFHFSLDQCLMRPRWSQKYSRCQNKLVKINQVQKKAFNCSPKKTVLITWIFLTSFEVPFPSFLGACNKQQIREETKCNRKVENAPLLDFSVKQILERLAKLLKFTLLHLHIPFPCYQGTCRKQLFQNQTNAETTNSSKLIPILSQFQNPLTNSSKKNFAIFVVSWKSILIFLLSCLLCPASLQRLSHFLEEFSPFRHPYPPTHSYS